MVDLRSGLVFPLALMYQAELEEQHWVEVGNPDKFKDFKSARCKVGMRCRSNLR